MACRRCASAGYTQNCEGTHASVRSGPGVVYLALKRIYAGEQAQGLPIKSMFVEMTVSEAVGYRKLLDEAIGIAMASAVQPSGLDGGAWL